MFRSRLILRQRYRRQFTHFELSALAHPSPGDRLCRKILCRRLLLWHPRTGVPIDSSGTAVSMSSARNVVSQLALHRNKNDRQTILPVTLEGNGDTAAD